MIENFKGLEQFDQSFGVGKQLPIYNGYLISSAYILWTSTLSIDLQTPKEC